MPTAFSGMHNLTGTSSLFFSCCRTFTTKVQHLAFIEWQLLLLENPFRTWECLTLLFCLVSFHSTVTQRQLGLNDVLMIRGWWNMCVEIFIEIVKCECDEKL